MLTCAVAERPFMGKASNVRPASAQEAGHKG
jgi:hypothetical protein